MDAVEQALASFFLGTMPAFPPDLKKSINRFYPQILIIFSALAILIVLPALGLGALFAWLAPVHSTMYMLIMVLLGLRAVLGLFGGFKMVSASKMGWNFAFYSDLLAVVVSVVDFSFFGIVWNFVMLWALFQIREYYTGGEGSIM